MTYTLYFLLYDCPFGLNTNSKKNTDSYISVTISQISFLTYIVKLLKDKFDTNMSCMLAYLFFNVIFVKKNDSDD